MRVPSHALCSASTQKLQRAMCSGFRARNDTTYNKPGCGDCSPPRSGRRSLRRPAVVNCQDVIEPRVSRDTTYVVATPDP